jgi:hypothetical protein
VAELRAVFRDRELDDQDPTARGEQPPLAVPHPCVADPVRPNLPLEARSVGPIQILLGDGSIRYRQKNAALPAPKRHSREVLFLPAEDQLVVAGAGTESYADERVRPAEPRQLQWRLLLWSRGGPLAPRLGAGILSNRGGDHSRSTVP